MTRHSSKPLSIEDSAEVAFNVPFAVNAVSRMEPREPSPALFMAMRQAQQKWAAQGIRERLTIIRQFRELLASDCENIGTVIARSTRRPVAEVIAAQILPLLDACRFLERAAAKVLRTRRLGASGRPVLLFGVRAEVTRDAHGLVLVVAPSNYPLFLPGVQVLQALVAGNAILLKPGTGCRETAGLLADLLNRAGLPPNLLHVLSESPHAAQAAIDCGVDKVVFTGSARTGAAVLQRLAPHLIPATMELSGCDAVIVRADADLDLVARGLAFGLQLNAGETCIAPRRIFVPEKLATELEGRIAETFSALPVLSLSQARRANVRRLVADALAHGGHLVAGNTTSDETFRAPVIIAGVPHDSPLLREDYFAPLATLTTVRDDEEALQRVAECPYALGASVFSRDIVAAEQLASRVRAGVVVINDLIAPTADPRLPFGGRGRSGFGVTRGAEGLLEMTVPKVIMRRAGTARPHYAPLRESDATSFAAFARLAHGRDWKSRLGAVWQLLSSIRRRGNDKEAEKS